MPPRVAIVGAGVAGLRAAQILRREGVDVFILEASAALGGRIKQDTTLVPGVEIDLGAEFLHGSDTCLVRLAKELNWELDEVFTVSQGDGGPVPSKGDPEALGLYYLGKRHRTLYWESEDEDFERLNDFFWELHEKTTAEGMDGDPRTLREYMRDCGVPRRMLSLGDAGYANTVGATADRVGAAGVCHLERNWADEGEGDFRPRKSMRQLIAYLTEGLEECVHTSWPVASIDCEPARCRGLANGVESGIQMLEGSGGKNRSEKPVGSCVRITARDGRAVEATHVVVAVPLTVLREGDISFMPPLPDEKKAALEMFGMDRVVKVLLTFSTRWYPAHLHGMVCADCPVPEFWFRELPAAAPKDNDLERDGPNGSGNLKLPSAATCLVVGFASSDKADALVAAADGAVAVALDQLDRMFRSGKRTRPASSSFLSGSVKDWKDEPFIRGGYSYPRPGFRSWAPAALSAPMADRHIFFAGEHTSDKACMSVHAAYSTGDRAASEVLTALGLLQAAGEQSVTVIAEPNPDPDRDDVQKASQC